MDKTIEQNLIEEFGVMNFQKIEQIQDKLENNSELSKNESQYIVYAFNWMYGNLAEMISYFADEQAKVRVIYEYMKRMGLNFDRDILKECYLKQLSLRECSENLDYDIINEFEYNED